MLTTVLLTLAVIVTALITAIALRPSEFRIERTAKIAASPATLFGHINDFHKWEAWSPWARLDPGARNSFSGKAAGPGAVFAWSGNNKVGEGRMTITESRPGELIRMKLDFMKPFKATNTAEFTFKPEGDRTLVAWSMAGRNNFMGKAIGLFMNCDKMAGAQFEQGLENLRSVTRELAHG
ncbi:MAG: SRPBCC family protein [Beijerinckiaceae bacterium]|nr:SRPBCC family protein [Beijerinckiaceae bacterium]